MANSVFNTGYQLQDQITSNSQAISNISSPYDLGTFSSESNLATALDTKISAMSNGSVASIRFQISSATDNFSAYTYVGTLTKISSQYASMTVAISTSSGMANVVVGSRNNTWVFKKLALQESIDIYNLGEGTLSTIESALTTFGASMANNEVRNIRFGITANSPPLMSTTYFGTISRNSSGRYLVHGQGISAPYMDVEGNYRNSAWEWDTMNIRGLLGSINNSSKTITFTAGVGLLLICEGSTTSRQGIYMVRGGTAGTTVNTVLAGSALTVSVSANGDAITVTSNQSGQVYLYAILYSGQKSWTVT